MPELHQSVSTRDANVMDEDKEFELSLRPTRLDEYIGQRRATDNLKIFIRAARNRGEALDHVLLSGPPGRQDHARADRRQRDGSDLAHDRRTRDRGGR